jgi:hypothetical protein
MPFLQRGTAVLVEKPLARDEAEARQMLDAASASGVVFGVGHTERFNPAVVAALPLVSNPRFVEVHRLGTFPERSLDIDVCSTSRSDLDVVRRSSVRVVGVEAVSGRPDTTARHRECELRFASVIANITASRISRIGCGRFRIFQHDAYLSIDYAARSGPGAC